MTDAMTDATAEPHHPPLARKLAWIAGLAAATLIPGLLVAQLVGERQDRAATATAGIAGAWGPQQLVAGPSLLWSVADRNGSEPSHRLRLAPRSLDARVTIAPSTRRRGLFDATVYEATVTMSGAFELPDTVRSGLAASPAKALVAVTLPGTQGMRDDDRVEIAGAKLPWQSCAELLAEEAACRGEGEVLVAEVELGAAEPRKPVPFAVSLHLRGTTSLRLATTAKAATVRIAGLWPTPGFIGGELPTTAAVKDGGFTADWAINHLGRPQLQRVMSLGAADIRPPRRSASSWCRVRRCTG